MNSEINKETRESCLCALKTVLKNINNINIIEKNIYNSVKEKHYNNEEEYKRVVFQTIGDILESKFTLKDIVSNIKNNNIGWKHKCYTDIKNKLDEHDDFIVNPFEVVEGVTTCNKCGSKRVFTFQKQCRGSDEPMTTFAKCVECRSQWSYSG